MNKREPMVKAEVVAEYIDEHVQTVYRKARAGIYPAHRCGRHVRFKLSEIDKATLKGAEA